MVKSISFLVAMDILQGKTVDPSKYYVHYDETDDDLVTQYDSHVFTQWKKGSEVLHLPPVTPHTRVIIKDIPFKVKCVKC